MPEFGDEAVRRRTGKGRDEWFAILDAWGAKEKGHRATAKRLAAEHGVGGWYAQAITVEYERARGLREVGQKGEHFEMSVTRTIRATPEATFEALTRARHWNRWLTTKARVNAKVGGRFSDGDGDRGEFLRLSPPHFLRMTWEDGKRGPGSVVEFDLKERADGRITLCVLHRKLSSQAERKEMQRRWRGAMDSLGRYLETGREKPAGEGEA
jgi:uncharacterized protein YndB with AHSA1/START domain